MSAKGRRALGVAFLLQAKTPLAGGIMLDSSAASSLFTPRETHPQSTPPIPIPARNMSGKAGKIQSPRFGVLCTARFQSFQPLAEWA